MSEVTSFTGQVWAEGDPGSKEQLALVLLSLIMVSRSALGVKRQRRYAVSGPAQVLGVGHIEKRQNQEIASQAASASESGASSPATCWLPTGLQ